jgi:MerR family mercuric resistance operon transcriptional regulator
MTINQLASEMNVSIQTIRYYEKFGLIAPVKRLPSGYRSYDQKNINQVCFIKSARELDFSLHEILKLMKILKIKSKSQQCINLVKKFQEKLDQIQERISDLKSISNRLQMLLNDCHRSQNKKDCLLLVKMYQNTSNRSDKS